ncbi:MAG TPA: hypothetical protein VGZ26_05180 [Pirellulales bacterium]|nr:hypothetical protein [Pirellulales bacterium]
MSASHTIARRRLRRLLDLLRTLTLGHSSSATAGVLLLACVVFARASADENQGGAGAKDSSVDPDGAQPQYDLLGRPLSIVERLDNFALPKHLKKVWQNQRQEIRSATIRFRQLHCAEVTEKDPLQQGHGLAGRTRDEVNTLLEQFDLAGDPDRLLKLRDAILSGYLIKDQPAYRVITLAVDGAKLRVDWDDGVSRVFDGENCIVHERSLRQATIFGHWQNVTRSPAIANQMVRTGFVFESLRTLPTISRAMLLNIERRGSVATLQSLVNGGYAQEITADGDGAVYRITRRRCVSEPTTAQVQTGGVEQEIIQSGFLNYPGNILFPSVRIATWYWGDDKLKLITISIIEEATFNQPVAPETFVAAVPENTAVWDKRNGLKLRAAEKAVGNVLTLFEK